MSDQIEGLSNQVKDLSESHAELKQHVTEMNEKHKMDEKSQKTSIRRTRTKLIWTRFEKVLILTFSLGKVLRRIRDNAREGDDSNF